MNTRLLCAVVDGVKSETIMEFEGDWDSKNPAEQNEIINEYLPDVVDIFTKETDGD